MAPRSGCRGYKEQEVTPLSSLPPTSSPLPLCAACFLPWASAKFPLLHDSVATLTLESLKTKGFLMMH